MSSYIKSNWSPGLYAGGMVVGAEGIADDIAVTTGPRRGLPQLQTAYYGTPEFLNQAKIDGIDLANLPKDQLAKYQSDFEAKKLVDSKAAANEFGFNNSTATTGLGLLNAGMDVYSMFNSAGTKAMNKETIANSKAQRAAYEADQQATRDYRASFAGSK